MSLLSVKTLSNSIKKNSPTLLMISSIGGVILTGVMAVTATPKAMKLIKEEITRLEKELNDPTKTIELDKWEIVKVAWPAFIPPVIMGAATIASIIAGNTINAKRNAAITSAYFLSETALKEYQAKVIEKIGEKKAQLIKDEIAQDRVTKNKKDDKTVIITGNGDTLCYDMVSGRYFKSSVDKLRKAENEINRQLNSDMWLSLNDMYYILGMTPTSSGNELGWDINADGTLRFDIGACLSENDEPCITFDFDAKPKPKY